MIHGTAEGDVHPHVTFVITAHERLEQGDMAAINDMFAADIVWHEFGTSPLAGKYIGRDDVMAFWKTYFAAAGPGFRQGIRSVMANDEYASSIVELSGTKSAATLTQTAVDVMRMVDGRIAEFWRYYADLGQVNEYFSAAP